MGRGRGFLSIEYNSSSGASIGIGAVIGNPGRGGFRGPGAYEVLGRSTEGELRRGYEIGGRGGRGDGAVILANVEIGGRGRPGPFAFRPGIDETNEEYIRRNARLEAENAALRRERDLAASGETQPGAVAPPTGGDRPPAAPPATPPARDFDIQKQAQGPYTFNADVLEAQRLMSALNAATPGGIPGFNLGQFGDAKDGLDGKFGDKTFASVNAMQKFLDPNAAPNGHITDEFLKSMRDKLEALRSPAPSGPTTTPPGATATQTLTVAQAISTLPPATLSQNDMSFAQAAYDDIQERMDPKGQPVKYASEGKTYLLSQNSAGALEARDISNVTVTGINAEITAGPSYIHPDEMARNAGPRGVAIKVSELPNDLLIPKGDGSYIDFSIMDPARYVGVARGADGSYNITVDENGRELTKYEGIQGEDIDPAVKSLLDAQLDAAPITATPAVYEVPPKPAEPLRFA